MQQYLSLFYEFLLIKCFDILNYNNDAK